MVDTIKLHDMDSGLPVRVKVTELGDGDFVFGVQSGVKAAVLEVAPTLDTSQYADGDVLSDTTEISNAVSVPAGASLIHSITILDKDDQGGALDVVLLRSNVSLGTKNAAVSISDSNAEEILGIVSVEADDYKDLVNSQVVTKEMVGIVVEAGVDETSIFVALISRDTKIYSASGLVVKLGIAKD